MAISPNYRTAQLRKLIQNHKGRPLDASGSQGAANRLTQHVLEAATNQASQGPGLRLQGRSDDHQNMIAAKIAAAKKRLAASSPKSIQAAMAEYDLRYPASSAAERARVKSAIVSRLQENPLVRQAIKNGESLYSAGLVKGAAYDKRYDATYTDRTLIPGSGGTDFRRHAASIPNPSPSGPSIALTRPSVESLDPNRFDFEIGPVDKPGTLMFAIANNLSVVKRRSRDARQRERVMPEYNARTALSTATGVPYEDIPGWLGVKPRGRGSEAFGSEALMEEMGRPAFHNMLTDSLAGPDIFFHGAANVTGGIARGIINNVGGQGGCSLPSRRKRPFNGREQPLTRLYLPVFWLKPRLARSSILRC